MVKWEYLTVALGVSAGFLGSQFNGEAVNAELNQKGAEGWELVSAVDTNGYHGASDRIVLIFKRPRSVP